MSDSPADNFAYEVAELFSARMKVFAGWCAADWKLTYEDAVRDNLDMTPEQVDGWNRCCESIEGAASVWLEEFNP